MPRPRKQKNICCMPSFSEFAPSGACSREPVFMNVEEYETIRLIDHENLTQEECADAMNVARSTVQRLYTDARSKIADSIVDGRPLKITGGDYAICAKFADKEACMSCAGGRQRRGIR